MTQFFASKQNLALLTLLLVIPMHSKASLFTSSTLSKATGNRGGISPVQNDTDSSASSATAFSENSYQYGLVSSGSSSSFSSTSAGNVKVSAFAAADASFGGVYPTFFTDTVRTDAQAQARLNDRFIVHADGIASGTHGTLTVEFEVSGLLGSGIGTGDRTGLAQWTSFVDLQSTGGIGGTFASARWSGGELSSFSSSSGIEKLITKDYGTDGTPSPGSHSLTLAFLFDSPIKLDIFGQTDAWVNTGSFCSGSTGNVQCTSTNAAAFADLSHTIAWRGITSVVDQNGNAINNFTGFSPDTQFDYRTSAVPLPNALFFFVTGLGFFFKKKG